MKNRYDESFHVRYSPLLHLTVIGLLGDEKIQENGRYISLKSLLERYEDKKSETELKTIQDLRDFLESDYDMKMIKSRYISPGLKLRVEKELAGLKNALEIITDYELNGPKVKR